MSKHSHYFKDVSGLDVIDVYRLLELFEVTCPVAQHIVKKALAAGKRGAKSQAKDMQEIADSAGRWLQMRQEDDGWTDRAIKAAGFGQINTLDMLGTAVCPAYHDQFDETQAERVVAGPEPGCMCKGGLTGAGGMSPGMVTGKEFVLGEIMPRLDAFDEARIDQIARSHGDGEHYGETGQ